MLTPKDLWYRDLDKFLEEWQACLEADASHLASAKNASKGKGRAKAAKKKAAYGDDSGDEDVCGPLGRLCQVMGLTSRNALLQDYAPTKKKASPKAKKTSPKVKKEPPAKKIEEKPSSKRSAESDADEKPAKKPPAKKVKKVRSALFLLRLRHG